MLARCDVGENPEITSKGYLSLSDHEHMSRGITLTEKEMRQIFDLMKRRRMNHREGQTQGEDPKPDPPAKKGKEPER